MNNDSKKENLWIIGGLLIVLGGSLIGLFILINKELYFFSRLNLYALGFLITGLIVLVFGFLFALIGLEKSEAEKPADNANKIRIMLITVTAIYIILIVYLMVTDYEWTVRALIIEAFDPSFGFYETFTISNYSAMFAALLSFGIFVLPFVINESRILDNYTREQPADLEEGQPIDGAEESFDRFVVFLKRQFGSIKKINKFTLPMGITLTILGICLVRLPYFLFIDGPWTLDPKTETEFIKDYKGFIRGQLLLIGILLLVIGLILIIYYIRRRRHAVDK